MNQVVLIGNLTRDIELRDAGGTSVGSFGLAVNWRGAEGKEGVDFFNIDVWGKQAENCAKYISKGSKVGVVGQLKSRSWEDKETGAKRTAVSVRAQNVEFLTSKRERTEDEVPVEDVAPDDFEFQLSDTQDHASWAQQLKIVLKNHHGARKLETGWNHTYLGSDCFLMSAAVESFLEQTARSVTGLVRRDERRARRKTSA
jgi:single-strand DNA-binding protein